MQQILCVTFSAIREWDNQNVIITGSTDGVVRMWSMDYVQIPIVEYTDNKNSNSQIEPESITASIASTYEKKPKVDLVKQFSSDTLVKSGSESSISEACDSIKENTKRFESEKDECVLEGGNIKPEIKTELATLPLDIPELELCKERRNSKYLNMKTKLRSVSHIESECSSEMNSEKSASKVENDGKMKKGIRPSKSDTSLTDSFVIIDNEFETKKKALNPENLLREGFKWQRQLVFRSKLTMHTAYDRKDNTEPASITALAVSKDHKTLYVGNYHELSPKFSI